MVTSIKRSIYNHVNDLIAQNEERPEQLARIFHDLQNINNRHEINNQTQQADTTTENVSRSLNRPSWGSSMYDGVQDEPDEDENDVSSSSFFKVSDYTAAQ